MFPTEHERFTLNTAQIAGKDQLCIAMTRCRDAPPTEGSWSGLIVVVLKVFR
jgi:hypothetical protein